MSGDVHNISYYQTCMVGGVLSCGITHGIMTPVDIVKCRMQVSLQFSFASVEATEIGEKRVTACMIVA